MISAPTARSSASEINDRTAFPPHSVNPLPPGADRRGADLRTGPQGPFPPHSVNPRRRGRSAAERISARALHAALRGHAPWLRRAAHRTSARPEVRSVRTPRSADIRHGTEIRFRLSPVRISGLAPDIRPFRAEIHQNCPLSGMKTRQTGPIRRESAPIRRESTPRADIRTHARTSAHRALKYRHCSGSCTGLRATREQGSHGAGTAPVRFARFARIVPVQWCPRYPSDVSAQHHSQQCTGTVAHSR